MTFVPVPPPDPLPLTLKGLLFYLSWWAQYDLLARADRMLARGGRYFGGALTLDEARILTEFDAWLRQRAA